MSEGQSNSNTFSSVTDAKPFVPSVQRKTALKTNATPFVPNFAPQTESENIPNNYNPMPSHFYQNPAPMNDYGYDMDAGYDNQNQDMYYYYQDVGNQTENPLSTLFVFPPPPRKLVKSLFVPSDIQRYYEMETAAIIDQEPPSDPHYKQIPTRYQSLKKLDETLSDNTTGSFGYISSTYKVIDKNDGLPYLLRRFERVRTTNEQIEFVLKSWCMVSHPNIVGLKDCYLYNGALIFIHEFYPNAQSLAKRYCVEKGAKLSEDLLWSILIQVLLALHPIHTKGLACRSVSILHILDTGRYRFRLGSCGINDVLDPVANMEEEQIKDLFNLGRVMLTLGCPSNGKVSLNTFSCLYSRSLTALVNKLLSRAITCSQAIEFALPQIIRTLNYSFMSNDSLSNYLSTEVNNSRYLRMLIKLGFINERPSLMSNTCWSETGDRYLLKLFRDYLFHQEDENGVPNLDIGHVFDTLSKLDIGLNEQIALHSRDGKTFLICTYTDIKHALESAFLELREKMLMSTNPPSTSASMGYPSSMMSPLPTMAPSSGHMPPVMQPMMSSVQSLPKSMGPNLLSSPTPRPVPGLSMSNSMSSPLPMNMPGNMQMGGPLSPPLPRYSADSQYPQNLSNYPPPMDQWPY